MRNNYNTKALKTFILLCLLTCLFLYSGSQIFEINELKLHIAQHEDLRAEEMKVEHNLQQLIDVEERELAGPSLAVRNITYPIFQSNISAEFPHIVNGTARIPHILHQIGNTETIPDNFLLPMRSFVKNNPTWEYRFWTYHSGYKFLKKYHPYLADVYESFGENDVKKSDLLRIAVLYEYGGIYADVDVSNVRSLDITTTKYACVIPTEPFEHASILYKQPFVLTSSVLLCRPKHPFFEKLLLHLQIADARGHPVPTTGPIFITSMYIQYYNLTLPDIYVSTFDNTRSNAPYFYNETTFEENDDAIYIPNSQYFSDNVDPTWITSNGSLTKCLTSNLQSDSIFIQRACKEFESRKIIRKEKQYTFTIHHWYHWWTKGGEALKFLQKYNIMEIIPKAILFEKPHSNVTTA